MSYAGRYRRKKSNAGVVVFIFGLILSAGLVLGIVALAMRLQQKPAAQQPLQRWPAPQVFAVYAQNEISGDQQFKGRLAEVSGIVLAVKSTLFDQPFVTLESGKGIFHVQCMFADSERPTLASINPGTPVVIRGVGDGKLGNVVFRDCKVVEITRFKGAK